MVAPWETSTGPKQSTMIESLKQAAAEAAITYVQPGQLVGIGTGSTVNYFIDALANAKIAIRGAVPSSQASAKRLQKRGISLIESDKVFAVDLYVDGADEVNPHNHLLKGGGAALTGEKIIAAMARQFICIVDHKKLVTTLGKFPLPVEVIPLAKEYVAHKLIKLGGQPIYRDGVVTDYGNIILDVHRLVISDPLSLERTINQIPGVVTVGLFAERKADKILISTPEGIQRR